MKIYHGTSHKYFNKIILEGITPRDTRKSNWSKHPSKSDMVYLTNTYPFTFACNAINGTTKCAVYEIDLMSLDHELLYPDEDFIWMAAKERFRGGTPKGLHEKMKESIEEFRQFWVHSLDNLGNCAYADTIETGVIERVCIVDFGKRPDLMAEVLQPAITVINHRIMSDHYCKMIQWFFGDIKELPQVERAKEWLEMFGHDPKFRPAIDFWIGQSKSRTGIEVINF